jgi:signal transduction histidine kinase
MYIQVTVQFFSIHTTADSSTGIYYITPNAVGWCIAILRFFFTIIIMSPRTQSGDVLLFYVSFFPVWMTLHGYSLWNLVFKRKIIYGQNFMYDYHEILFFHVVHNIHMLIMLEWGPYARDVGPQATCPCAKMALTMYSNYKTIA